MKLSRLIPSTAVALLLALTVAGCSGGSIPEGTALGPSGPGVPTLSFGQNSAIPGETINYALWHPSATGNSLVHLKSVQVLGISPQFVIDRVVGLWGRPNGAFSGWDGGLGAIDGTPINRIVLDPRCPPASQCSPPKLSPGGVRTQNWVIYIQAHITRPGRYRSKGLRVVYAVDGQEYQQTFLDSIGADSGPGNIPQSSPTAAT